MSEITLKCKIAMSDLFNDIPNNATKWRIYEIVGCNNVARKLTSKLQYLISKMIVEIENGNPPQRSVDNLLNLMYWRKDSVMAEFRKYGTTDQEPMSVLYEFVRKVISRLGIKAEVR